MDKGTHPSLDMEKGNSHDQVEEAELPVDAVYVADDGITPEQEKKIIRKIDFRLVVALGLMLAVSLIDRSNLGYANIAGMRVELQLSIGNRFSICLLMFFISYIIFEPAGALVTKWLGPRILLPGLVCCWGVLTIGIGFVNHWQHLAGLRVLVGFFEAFLMPAALYLLQSWYRRYDVQRRYAVFYIIASIGASMAGVMAFGFMQMGGVGGYLGWRYIFIWEGVLTIVVGVICGLLIVDFPEKAHNSWKFLKPHELEHILKIIREDRGENEDTEPFTWKVWAASALDWKIWVCGLLYYCNAVIVYAIAFFLPIILNLKMGFSIGISQVLSTPPYFVCCAVMYFEAWLGDHYRYRGPIIVFNSLLTIVGLALMMYVDLAGVQYFGVFIVASTVNSSLPAIMAFQSNNLRGTWKRAFGSAMLAIMGGLGGVTGSCVFRSVDAPQYWLGMYFSIGCCVVCATTITLADLYMYSINKKADRDGTLVQGLPGFRYTY